MEQPTNTARLNDELDLPEKYIAVQIRRGDKVAGNRKDWGERFCWDFVQPKAGKWERQVGNTMAMSHTGVFYGWHIKLMVIS